MNVKIELSDELINAIDMARRLEPAPIPPRTEMIRKLLGIGLAENLKREAASKEKFRSQLERHLNAPFRR